VVVEVAIASAAADTNVNARRSRTAPRFVCDIVEIPLEARGFL
jgi:hypothetical protein